jgi:hypothetical protein
LADETGEPAEPAKLSLNTVVQPGGGPGTVVAATGWLSATAAATDADNAAKTAAMVAIRRRLCPELADIVGQVPIIAGNLLSANFKP